MADSSSTKRRRLTLIGSAAAALALSLSLAPGTAAAGPPDSSPGATKAAWSGEPVTVMTRNLYLGADLSLVIGALATNPAALPQAASATWAAVQATVPEERMAAVADEIAAHAPAVVGLQEVSTWTTYDSFLPEDLGTVRYDFLELLLDALDERGMTYYEVEGATSENFDSGRIPLLPASGAAAVSLTDRDVIIRRSDVETSNPHNARFTNILKPPAIPLEVPRGWGSVDVEVDTTEFRFVNSHLEAGFAGFDAESLRVAQVKELLAAQDAITAAFGDLPDVYVGDYNSVAPTGSAYRELRTELRDAWLPGNGMAGGDTCCQVADLTNATSDLDERIDLVLLEEKIRSVGTYLVGDTPVDLTGNVWWASDHAGVVADLLFKR